MRNLVMAGCALLMLAGDRPAADDPQTVIRREAERFETAVLKKDKATLETLFHADYRLQPPIGGFAVTDGMGRKYCRGLVDRPLAIAYYTDPGRTFQKLNYQPSNIRRFGDTAVETGSLVAMLNEFGMSTWWENRSYTRVWVRDANAWRLAHEHY